ncbi:MAG: DeoR/GlpR family DNA-binding transcription regulator [Lachnospiraceae bacterium]|nr:DeoR/GlpR family DNA-binding transcription regulator [Lachnospiraceae bacterium]
MLTEERFAIILDTVNKKKSVHLNELCDLLEISVSTARRDINVLAEMGKLIKVHGGAVAIDMNDNYLSTEKSVAEKALLFPEEKTAIAKYAASLINEGDFVFIDAGTTTAQMLDFIPLKNISFVTNSFNHAKRLTQRGFQVFIPGGEIRPDTEAIIGEECVLMLENYNFTKCFMGTNGISVSAGFTTQNIKEARVKTAAINGSRKSYILADHSKFDKISFVTFAHINEASIITDTLSVDKWSDRNLSDGDPSAERQSDKHLSAKEYSGYTTIKEVI